MSAIILFIVLLLAFVCGDNVLNVIGYPHHDFSTSILYRLHPLTYFAIILLMYYLIVGRIRMTQLFHLMKDEAIFLAVCFVIFAFLYFTDNLNAISFLLDALCLPAFLSIILKATDKNVLNRYRRWIYIFFFLNAFIAIIEKILGRQLIGNESFDFIYFRSSAIFGHPLNNALIMSVLTIVLFYSNENKMLKTSVLFFGMLSIFCFGARGALIGVFLSVVVNIVLNIVTHRKSEFGNIYVSNGLKYLFLFGAIIFIILNYTNFGDRINALSHMDSSADARVYSFDVLNGLSFKELLWGFGTRQIDYFKYLSGVEIIENFWIVWVLRFGLIITVFLFLSLFRFLYAMMKRVTIDISLTILLVLFFVASTNNSLSSNTLVLSMLVLSFYILYNDEAKNSSLAILTE